MRSCWPLNPPVTLLLALAIPLTLQAQVTAIKAGTLIDPETGSAAKAQVILVEGAKVTAVFTPFPEGVLKEFQGEEAGRQEYQQEIDRLRSGYRMGVTIAFGTDAIHDLPGHTRGSLAMTWVDSYLDAGLTPKAILQAMTVNAARLLGVDQERGAIKPGLAADVIAVPGTPLEDHRILRQVNFVMKDGKVIR
ncbi:MAG: amidohydrolase family protein [Gemmatimonadales bacterium]